MRATPNNRIKRSYPVCLSQLLSDVFETLALAHRVGTGRGAWTLETGDRHRVLRACR